MYLFGKKIVFLHLQPLLKMNKTLFFYVTKKTPFYNYFNSN